MNTDKRYEESELVELVRNELKINHNAISLETKNFLPRLRELIRYHDAPVYTIFTCIGFTKSDVGARL